MTLAPTHVRLSAAPAALPATKRRATAARVTAAAASSAVRFEWIDALRVPAAVLVVLHHAAGGYLGPVGFLGVPFFVLVAVSLAAASGTRASLADEVARRSKRLLAPFALWTCAYLGLRVALYGPDDVLANLKPGDLALVGGAYHLWFLPFLFAALLAVRLIRPVLRAGDTQRRATAALCLVAAGVAVYAGGLPVGFSDDAAGGLRRWLHELPLVLVGVAVGATLRHEVPRIRQTRPTRWLRVALLLLAAGAVTAAYFAGPDRRLTQVAAACLFVWVVLAPAVTLPPAVRRLAGLTMDVYLAHVAVLMLAARAMPWLNLPQWAEVSAVTLVTLAGAFLTACTLHAYRSIGGSPAAGRPRVVNSPQPAGGRSVATAPTAGR